MKLLQKLCSIRSPSGNESNIRNFLLDYIDDYISNFKVKPIVITDNIQDCIILKFGKPKTAIFSHIDSIGFTVRYGKELIKIGGPKTNDGIKLVGKDSKGEILTEIYNYEDHNGNNHIEYLFDREIERATELTFKPNWREDENFIQCCYMDNRLGVWNALKVAHTLENGAICFSTHEEVGGGSVGFLGKYIYRRFFNKNKTETQKLHIEHISSQSTDTIMNDNITPPRNGYDYSVSFWFYIDDFYDNFGVWRHIMHKGSYNGSDV